MANAPGLVQAGAMAQIEQSYFAQLVQMARHQPEPQRLLFVFVGAELPSDATPEQRERFHRGEGGALVPWMTVDKDPAELTTFEALADEATAMRSGWKAMFVAALSGRDGQPPRPADIDRALRNMEDAIKQGRVQGFLVLDRSGGSSSARLSRRSTEARRLLPSGGLRLLLKRVQHVHRISYMNYVDGTEGVATVILDPLVHPPLRATLAGRRDT